MKLTADKVIFAFSKYNEAAAVVEAPVTIDVMTKDCFSNQLRNPEDNMDVLKWDDTTKKYMTRAEF